MPVYKHLTVYMHLCAAEQSWIGDAWKTTEEDKGFHTLQSDMSQGNRKLQTAIRKTVGDPPEQWRARQKDRQTVVVSPRCLFSSPVWCTAACHWSAVCACPSKESSSSWLLPLSLYLEAIKVLLSGKKEKWTDKERSVSGWEKNGRALERKSVISSHAQWGPERHWALRWHFRSGWGVVVPSIFSCCNWQSSQSKVPTVIFRNC